MAGITAYRLWEKGELKKDMDWEAAKREGLALTQEMKERGMVIKGKLEAELQEVDWSELQSKLQDTLALGKNELEELKGSFAFLKDKSTDIDLEKAKKDLGVGEIEVPDDIPDDILSLDGPDAAEKVSRNLQRKPELNSDPESNSELESDTEATPEHASIYPVLEKNRNYVMAMAELEKAKEENAKGMPGKDNNKKYLKKAVYLYKKCRDRLLKCEDLKGLNAREAAHVESLLEEVSKQIYWGSKLGAM